MPKQPSTAIAVASSPEVATEIERLLIQGDLSKLTEQQCVDYYLATCKSLGLNPLTKPFNYLVLNNKKVLYATKDCTEQLRKIHSVSVTDLSESMHGDVFIVKCKVCDKTGRTDCSTGAVNIKGIYGDALANAVMKAETKAKRRATLSICGLGMLDETEIETIPGATVQGASVEPKPSTNVTPAASKPEAPPAEPSKLAKYTVSRTPKPAEVPKANIPTEPAKPVLSDTAPPRTNQELMKSICSATSASSTNVIVFMTKALGLNSDTELQSVPKSRIKGVLASLESTILKFGGQNTRHLICDEPQLQKDVQSWFLAAVVEANKS